MTVPSVQLNDGSAIPRLGFGVFQVPPDGTVAAVSAALEAGYRSIDTAAAYRNERPVGEAIAAAGLAREEIYVTTKLWNSDHGRAHEALRRSLERLGLDRVDLYLIHWPVPSRDLYSEAWRALTELQAEGLARSIGVSNFQPGHLRRIIDETAVAPAVNQVELHPRLQQGELRRVHAELGIATEAWSPLAQGALLDDPAIVAIAERHGRTPAQIVLRWHVQLGNIVIPKSVTPQRIAENIALFDFELDAADMDAIAQLERGERIGPDPDRFAVA